MARLLLVLVVNGRARSANIEQLSEKQEKSLDETYMRMLQTVKLRVSWKDNVTNSDLGELHYL